MWFLEHESLFGGKRVWLRPGSQQLFGRTKSGDNDGVGGKTWKIDNKAVSRKHVMLRVLESALESGTKLHTKSQIEVTDLSCRQGTTVDEKDILKSKKAEDGTIAYKKTVLSGAEHSIRLAQGYPPFKLTWHPVVFTYASKETKEGKARSARLHALDIKTAAEFQFDKTTHVVSQKRNLPKVLSGLAAAKHIVTGEFIDAILERATSSVDAAENYVPSQLEENFDLWWPKEKEYIPPMGAEPVPQPQEMLEPDPLRAEVFSELTFVFLNDGQFSSLLDPISSAGGKALLFDVRPGETTVQEYVDYVHSVAGKKKRSRAGNEQIPVVTVRLPAYPDNMEKWAASFVSGVDQALHQRSILQNEFLNVILTKDRALLQKPPTEVIEVPSTDPEPATNSLQDFTLMNQSRKSPLQHTDDDATAEVEITKVGTRKRVHRAKTTSRFTGFDDYEPPPKKKKIEETESQGLRKVVVPTTASHGRNEPSPESTDYPNAQSPILESIEKEEQVDMLFPAAAKIKRQRGATCVPTTSMNPEAGGPVQQPKTKGEEVLERLQRAKAKADKEINVREQTRLRIKAEEDRRKADEENLREALEGVDIAEMKNFAPVEEMEVPTRGTRGITSSQGRGRDERWNADWNGRRNFKKFRRRGAEQGVPARKVLVTLEEAPPKKGFGIGDAFFLEVEDVPSSSKSRDRRRKDGDDDSEPEPGFTRQKRATQTQTQPEVINVEDSEPEEEALPAHTTQASSGRTQRVAETQVEETQTQTRRGKKRGSGGAAPGEPAGKRGKFARRKDDNSDDEETGFRFKRRVK